MFLYLNIYLPACLFVCLPGCLSFYISIFSIYLIYSIHSIYSIYFIYFVYSIYSIVLFALLTYLPIDRSIYLINLSIYLSQSNLI